VPVVKGDRYIVRLPSPSITVGGGQVVDPHPRRHKRFHEGTLRALETLQRGTPEEIVLQALGNAPADSRQTVERSGLDPTEAYAALNKLIAGEQILQLTGAPGSPPGRANSALVIATTAWEAIARQAEELLRAYHRQNPLRRGMGKEEMRSRLSAVLPSKAFSPAMALAVARGLIAEDATTYRLPFHQPTYTPGQKAQVERLMRAMSEIPYSPPSPAELGVEPEVLGALLEGGELVKIDENIYYTPAAYNELRAGVLHAIDTNGDVNVAAMRDLFGTTRKYAIPFLEHLDDLKVTRRVGDVRVRW